MTDNKLPESTRPSLSRIQSVKTASIIAAVSASLLTPQQSFGAPQLVVAPTRVILEGRNRAASVNLVNRGNETGTFRIKFERKRMTESGDIVPLKKAASGEMFADQMIRYAPRQITLAPGQSQVVRLMLRKPANLAAGEYRSHLLFQGIPPDAAKSIEAQSARKSKKLSIQIIPILGVSIPVIVRHGNTTASVSLGNLRLMDKSKDGKQAILQVQAKRSGNRSVYGDFTVFFTPKGSSSKVVVSQVNGAAIYTPLTSRVVKLPLRAPAGTRLDNGVVNVVYRLPSAQGDEVLAQATARIAPLAK